MLEFNNFIVRDDFYDNYCNLGGIALYVVAVFIVGYICWEFKKWF
jgi:hypothetical protein